MVNSKCQAPYGDDIPHIRCLVETGTNLPDIQTGDTGKPRERGQAVALFAILIPLMSIFAVLLMDYMITAARMMDAVAAADLAAHAGALEITVDPDGTIRSTGAGGQIAAAYFQAQHLPHTQLTSVQCGRFHDRPGCQVAAQVATPGFLLPKRWIQVTAQGYLAHGVTREDQ